jgi:hypothetical protein
MRKASSSSIVANTPEVKTYMVSKRRIAAYNGLSIVRIYPDWSCNFCCFKKMLVRVISSKLASAFENLLEKAKSVVGLLVAVLELERDLLKGFDLYSAPSIDSCIVDQMPKRRNKIAFQKPV